MIDIDQQRKYRFDRKYIIHNHPNLCFSVIILIEESSNRNKPTTFNLTKLPKTGIVNPSTSRNKQPKINPNKLSEFVWILLMNNT